MQVWIINETWFTVYLSSIPLGKITTSAQNNITFAFLTYYCVDFSFTLHGYLFAYPKTINLCISYHINSSEYFKLVAEFYLSFLLFWRDVFMEKHWKSVISRSVCDYFFDQQRKVSSPEDVPPVIATPHHYLISVYRCSMFFVAVCMTEGECLVFITP